MKKKKKKTLCERHYHNYANAKQTKGKPLLWLHMNPSATLYRLLRTIPEHLGPTKVFSIKQIVCVHVHKEIQTITTRQKQEHSKPNFKNYQQIRSSSHRIYLFGQFPLQFHLVSYSFYLSTLNIQQPKRTIWNYEFNSNRHTLCNQAKSENKQK